MLSDAPDQALETQHLSGAVWRSLTWLAHVSLAFRLCLFGSRKWRNRKKTKNCGGVELNILPKKYLLSFIFFKEEKTMFSRFVTWQNKRRDLILFIKNKKQMDTGGEWSPHLLPFSFSVTSASTRAEFLPCSFLSFIVPQCRVPMRSSWWKVFMKGCAGTQQTRACLARQRPWVQPPATNSNNKALLGSSAHLLSQHLRDWGRRTMSVRSAQATQWEPISNKLRTFFVEAKRHGSMV